MITLHQPHEGMVEERAAVLDLSDSGPKTRLERDLIMIMPQLRKMRAAAGLSGRLLTECLSCQSWRCIEGLSCCSPRQLEHSFSVTRIVGERFHHWVRQMALFLCTKPVPCLHHFQASISGYSLHLHNSHLLPRINNRDRRKPGGHCCVK